MIPRSLNVWAVGFRLLFRPYFRSCTPPRPPLGHRPKMSIDERPADRFEFALNCLAGVVGLIFLFQHLLEMLFGIFIRRIRTAPKMSVSPARSVYGTCRSCHVLRTRGDRFSPGSTDRRRSSPSAEPVRGAGEQRERRFRQISKVSDPPSSGCSGCSSSRKAVTTVNGIAGVHVRCVLERQPPSSIRPGTPAEVEEVLREVEAVEVADTLLGRGHGSALTRPSCRFTFPCTSVSRKARRVVACPSASCDRTPASAGSSRASRRRSRDRPTTCRAASSVSP